MKLSSSWAAVVCMTLVQLVVVRAAPAVSRTDSTPGIQMWSQPNFVGHFVHYAAPRIAFDKCCTPSRHRH